LGDFGSKIGKGFGKPAVVAREFSNVPGLIAWNIFQQKLFVELSRDLGESNAALILGGLNLGISVGGGLISGNYSFRSFGFDALSASVVTGAIVLADDYADDEGNVPLLTQFLRDSISGGISEYIGDLKAHYQRADPYDSISVEDGKIKARKTIKDPILGELEIEDTYDSNQDFMEGKFERKILNSEFNVEQALKNLKEIFREGIAIDQLPEKLRDAINSGLDDLAKEGAQLTDEMLQELRPGTLENSLATTAGLPKPFPILLPKSPKVSVVLSNGARPFSALNSFSFAC